MVVWFIKERHFWRTSYTEAIVAWRALEVKTLLINKVSAFHISFHLLNCFLVRQFLLFFSLLLAFFFPLAPNFFWWSHPSPEPRRFSSKEDRLLEAIKENLERDSRPRSQLLWIFHRAFIKIVKRAAKFSFLFRPRNCLQHFYKSPSQGRGVACVCVNTKSNSLHVKTLSAQG